MVDGRSNLCEKKKKPAKEMMVLLVEWKEWNRSSSAAEERRHQQLPAATSQSLMFFLLLVLSISLLTVDLCEWWLVKKEGSCCWAMVVKQPLPSCMYNININTSI